MGIENKCKIKSISKCLVDGFKAQEITKEEFLKLSENVSTIDLNNNSIIYKISDSNFIEGLLSENEKSEIQITIEHFNKKRTPKYNNLRDVTFLLATYIGLFQLLAAAFPGTSRSGATIIGALILGASRVAASEFTFVLAIPAMLGASLFEFKDFLEADVVISNKEIAVLVIGVAVAFAVSVLAIKFLMGYIKKRDFTVFGYYRIILGIIVLLYFIIR